MELEGTIVFDLPLQEGVSKAGRPWKKKEWVLETGGMYPRKVKFHVFNDRVDSLNFEVGKSYAVSFELESREFNGRWYTDVNVLGARPIESIGGMGAPMGMGMGMQQPAQAANFGTQPAAGYAQPQQPQQNPFAQPAAPATPQVDPFAGGNDDTDNLPF